MGDSGANPGAYRCKYTYCLPLTQQSAVFLYPKGELTMLNIELQHFGGRGAASSTAKGKSSLKYFKEATRQFNEAKISANKVKKKMYLLFFL